jgi:hypothetical protein
MPDDHQAIIHFWQTVSTVSITVIVTLTGFWVGIGRKLVNKEEITKMIHTECPYSKDREFIMERLANNKEAYAALSITLQKVIEVMTELKVNLATLSKTLESLEDRMDETEEEYQHRRDQNRYSSEKHKGE